MAKKEGGGMVSPLYVSGRTNGPVGGPKKAVTIPGGSRSKPSGASK